MLSKSRVIAHRQCPKRLWLAKHRPELASVDAGSKAAFSIGHQVGEIAHEIYGPGTLIYKDGDDFTDAIARTTAATRQRPGTFFEAVYARLGIICTTAFWNSASATPPRRR